MIKMKVERQKGTCKPPACQPALQKRRHTRRYLRWEIEETTTTYNSFNPFVNSHRPMHTF